MEKLLTGNEEALNILHEQYKSAIKKKEFSGSGFFTNFEIPKNALVLPKKRSFQFGDVVGEINDVENGVGFVLFVKEGKIDMLEGYTYEEKWPDKIINYKLSYISGDKRDLDKIRKKWQ